MADEVSIRIRLQGAQKFVTDSAKSAAAVKGIGKGADDASRSARAMGGAFSSAGNLITRSMGAAASQAKWLGVGVGAVAVAGVKMGLSFNSQVESARLRFGLFTNDVEGLTKAVQKIDLTSAFSFGDLSDAAALFGNAGIKDIPAVLQASANAAAASGKGVEGFKSIAIALSQIASKGRLSQEEINQLNEAGAPGAQRIIADHFQLTAKQLQNLGGQGLDAKEAIQALTQEWTSGKMAKAALDQTKTLGGQWLVFTGNLQKLTGAATESLAAGLRDTALPAINKATAEITEIFGRKGLSNEQKIAAARKVIVRELGPVWHDITDMIDEADIPAKLGKAVQEATPFVLNAMADIAPQAAKAFVDGWLSSGPEAQAITALFLGNKLRKSDFGKGLFSGGGGGGKKGPLDALMGTRGATPKNPLWVAVVNDLPGKKGTPVGDLAKKGGPAATAARIAALAGGGAEVGALGVGGGLAALLGVVAWKNAHNDFNSRGAGDSVRKAATGTAATPGFGGGVPGVFNINLKVNDKTISRVTASTDEIERGRLAATTAARK